MRDGLELGIFRGIITQIMQIKEDIVFEIAPIECLEKGDHYILFNNSDHFFLEVPRHPDFATEFMRVVFAEDLTADNFLAINFLSLRTQRKYLEKEVVVRFFCAALSNLEDYWPYRWAKPMLISPGVYTAQITLIKDRGWMSQWAFQIDSPQDLAAHKRIIDYSLHTEDLKKLAENVLHRSFILKKVDKIDLQDKYVQIVVQHRLNYGRTEVYIHQIKPLLEH